MLAAGLRFSVTIWRDTGFQHRKHPPRPGRADHSSKLLPLSIAVSTFAEGSSGLCSYHTLASKHCLRPIASIFRLRTMTPSPIAGMS